MLHRSALLLIALTIPTGLVLANSPFADPNALPKISCDAIHYNDAYLHRYPMAPAACVDGRIAYGQEWARFNTKVYLVDFPRFITVEMVDVAGNPISTFSFKPASSARILMNGKSIPFSEVEPGDLITFWKSQKRLDARAMPLETARAWQVLPPPGPPAMPRLVVQVRGSP